jgi:hypothetical protein
MLRYTLTILALLVLPSLAGAIPVPWPNPSGEVPGLFRWSNGQSDNGLFGAPVITSDGFAFVIENFQAVSQNGVNRTTTDRLFFQVELLAASQQPLAVMQHSGNFSIVGGGTVSSEAFLFLTNLDAPVNPPGNPLVQQASSTPDFPYMVPSGTNDTGPWSQLAAQFVPVGWQRFSVVANLVVQASTPPGGSASIAIAPGTAGLRLSIPEPAGAVCALAIAFRRRSRAAVGPIAK